MCEPTTAALAIGSLAASSYMNNQAAKKVASQRNKALLEDAAAQKVYQGQADEVNAKAQDNFKAENQTQMQANNEAKLKESLDASGGATGRIADYSATSAQSPDVVQSEIARKIGEAVEKGQASTSSLARLQSYGKTMFDNNVNLTNSASDIERINNFSRGTSAVLPFKLERANRAGMGSQNLASIFDGIGNLSMAYGLTRGPKTKSIFTGNNTVSDAFSNIG